MPGDPRGTSPAPGVAFGQQGEDDLLRRLPVSGDSAEPDTSPPRPELAITCRRDVLQFRRPIGREVVSDFGVHPFPLPEADVLLASGPLTDSLVGETTVWMKPD